jgi:hypothetical protein
MPRARSGHARLGTAQLAPDPERVEDEHHAAEEPTRSRATSTGNRSRPRQDERAAEGASGRKRKWLERRWPDPEPLKFLDSVLGAL